MTFVPTEMTNRKRAIGLVALPFFLSSAIAGTPGGPAAAGGGADAPAADWTAEVLRPSRVSELPGGGVFIDDGLRYARGQLMIVDDDGGIRLECVSVREWLLGRAPDFRFGNDAPRRMTE